MARPTPIYRPLLREALRLTWERKSLWVFGLFAGLMGTGGMAGVAWRDARGVRDVSSLFQDAVTGTVPLAGGLGDWVRQVELLPGGRVALTVTVASLVLIGLIACAALSQAALIRGLACEHDRPFHHTLREGRPFFWRLLALALWGKALRGALLALVSVPLVLFLAQGTAGAAWLYLATFLVAFPLAVVLSLVMALASIDAVREDRGAMHSFAHALGRFFGNWASALEVGLLSSLVTGGIWVATGAAVVLLTLPYGVLVALAIGHGSAGAFSAATAAFGILSGAVTFAGTGSATCFQYAVWVRFMDRTHPRKTPLVAKLERLWRKW